MPPQQRQPQKERLTEQRQKLAWFTEAFRISMHVWLIWFIIFFFSIIFHVVIFYNCCRIFDYHRNDYESDRSLNKKLTSPAHLWYYLSSSTPSSNINLKDEIEKYKIERLEKSDNEILNNLTERFKPSKCQHLRDGFNRMLVFISNVIRD